MAEKIATRQAYSEAIVELGKENENIVVLDADLAGATKSASFKKAFPHRHFNAGIAEFNMTNMAAGLSLVGKIPFVSTFAVFGTGRNYDAIRNAICYPNLNVKFALTHAGLTVGEDGATHQMLEDIALMNGLPNMKVFVPADAVEAKQAIKVASQIDGPVYVRLGRANTEVIFDENHKFESGKITVVKDGTDVAIFACGIMVVRALRAAEELEKSGISAAVLNVCSIKPLDEDTVVAYAKKTGAVITCEEHSKFGGLTSIIASTLSTKCPTIMDYVAVEDSFGESGTPDLLLEKYGLTVEAIVEKAKNLKK